MLEGNLSQDEQATVDQGLEHASVGKRRRSNAFARYDGLRTPLGSIWPRPAGNGGHVDDIDAGSAPIGSINPRDYRFVMSLARRYNAIVFWHRDRNGVDWQPLLLPLRSQSKERAGKR